MYKKKLTAEEILHEIKLRMNYDLNKTLKENSNVSGLVISEQQKNSNIITDEDLIGSTNLLRSYFQGISDFTALGLPNLYDIIGINFANLIAGKRTGVKGVVDALDGFVDEKDLAYVLSIIKSLDGKCYFDDVENKNLSATERFVQLYQEDEGEDLKDEVNSVGIKTLKVGTDKIKKLIIKAIDTQIAKGCASTPDKTSERQNNINNIYCGLKNGLISNPGSKLNGTKWEDYVKSYQVTDDEVNIAKASCPNTKQIPIPSELVNADGVKKFQDWLDGNHPGWATGYKDGILKQGQNGGGYGKFGPRTQKAWNNEQWRQEYLSGKSQPTSNPTVPPKPVDDGSTSVEGDDANNVLNQ